ncbi:hypothetical protein AURDEDRAFT_95872 [Auricularia subglabra TFB-10046 SS5]|nr:hypothetical protein AURDEDRAFT_95872 [Auricularia subglabra TFB-10046 SS5]
MLTSGAELNMQQAMAIASKIYKTYGTPQQLRELSTLQLEAEGLRANECKSVMAAVTKAGYKPRKGKAAATAGSSVRSRQPAAPRYFQDARKKRKRDSDLDTMLPSASASKVARVDLSFDEVLDEEAIQSESVITNRAPVMTAWAMIVGERMGFQREEALSIASAYTEMNAISKGVSIGVFNSSRGKGVELAKGEAQPYVDLMGRRIPVLKTREDKWRALVKGEPVDPMDAHGYIKRTFRDAAPQVLGAMRLLAATFTVAELNDRGFGLYADFRPAAEKWGARSEMRLANILALRRNIAARAEGQETNGTAVASVPPIGVESASDSATGARAGDDLDLDQYDDLFDAFEDADTDTGPSTLPP